MTKKAIWDIDGVLGDFVGDMTAYFHAVQGFPYENLPTPSKYHWASEWGITTEEWQRYYRDFVMQGHLRTMSYTQSLNSIRKAFYDSYNLGFTNIICTARGSEFPDLGFKKTARNDTSHWLHSSGINMFVSDVIHTSEKDKVDGFIFLDDAPHHLKAIQLAGKKVVCYKQPYNKSYKGTKVFTLADFVSILETYVD